MVFLYELLQSIGRPLQRRSRLASMSDMPHVSLPSRTTRLDRLERRHLRPSAPEQPWRPDVAGSAPVLPSLEWEIIKRAELAHLKTLLLRAGSPRHKGWELPQSVGWVPPDVVAGQRRHSDHTPVTSGLPL